MNIAIIPARGGSKRIPRKNIKEFAGKPMIAYAITAALESDQFEHVIVSTEDDEIAAISREWGAETPFMRPTELSDDYAPTVPVMAHAISRSLDIGWQFGFACCVYPCVPLIDVGDLQEAFTLLRESGVDYCFPVTEFPSAIQRALRREENGLMRSYYPEFDLARTQDLDRAFYDTGQFYWGTVAAWLTNHRIHQNGVGLTIPSWRVVDIDTPDDWTRAEWIFKALQNK